ncbi:MAG TPA: carboxypeptidase-like regulatory domain-containing protein, partial [Acidobacteriaceae bacterium]|nr:carboxypeptidase-like regulatory domain-containing protein [Acidobacteriaceae bacterium]
MLIAATTEAQVASEIRGRVIDPSGAAVASAEIQAVEVRTQARFATRSGRSGFYDFGNMVPGVYELDVVARGFRRLTRTGVTLAIGQTAGLDLVVSLGSREETVTVNSDAVMLQSQTSDIQMTIPRNHVEAIPLNSRNFVQLTQLAPGVELPPGTLLPRINGGRPRT